MTVALARTPTGRRLQLGVLMRQLRERCLLTQQQAGQLLRPAATPGSAQNKITRVESGVGLVDPALPGALLDIYDVRDPATIELAHELAKDITAARDRWRGPLACYRTPTERRYVELEEDADMIREVGTEEIPELLRTEEYLRARQPPYAPSTPVRAVLARQDVALRQETPIYAVLSESCIRRVQGSHGVLRDQVEHLAELSRLPAIRIQIVPFTPTTAAPLRWENFTLMRLRCPGLIDEAGLVFGWTRVAGDLLGVDTRLAAYESMWMAASVNALSPAETRDALLHAAKRLR